MDPESRGSPGAPEDGHLDAGLLYALVEGSMDERESLAWRSHIASCDRCKELERSLRPVAERLRGLAAAAEASSEGSLVGEIRKRLVVEGAYPPAPRTSARRLVRVPRPGLRLAWTYLAAAAVLVLGIGLAIVSGRPGPRGQGARLAERPRPPSKVELARPVEAPPSAASRAGRPEELSGRAPPERTAQAGPFEQSRPEGAPPAPAASGEVAPVPALAQVGGEGGREADAQVSPTPGSGVEREPDLGSGEVHIAMIARIDGFATYARGATGSWQPAREYLRLLPGDRLNTGAGRVELALEEGGRVYANQATVLRLLVAETGSGRSSLVDLARGELCVDEAGGRTCVETPHGVFQPLGTLFGVKANPAVTTLVVADGAVSARAKAEKTDWLSSTEHPAVVDLRGGVWAGREVRVEAGFSASVSAGVQTGPPTRTDVSRAFAWAFARSTRGLQALYLFKEGSGNVVHDVSGAGAPLDLTIGDPSAVSWLRGGGLSVGSPVVIASAGPAAKIVEACRASGELTIETLAHTRDSGGEPPLRIVSISKDPFHRNFTLGVNGPDQPDRSYGVRLRTTITTENGTLVTDRGPPVLSTARDTLATRLAHVVFAREASGVTRLYVDGAELAHGKVGGNLSNWDVTYPLVLANELTGDRPWLGELRLVAIYSRALDRHEVWRNYRAGALAYAGGRRGAASARD